MSNPFKTETPATVEHIRKNEKKGNKEKLADKANESKRRCVCLPHPSLCMCVLARERHKYRKEKWKLNTKIGMEDESTSELKRSNHPKLMCLPAVHVRRAWGFDSIYTNIHTYIFMYESRLSFSLSSRENIITERLRLRSVFGFKFHFRPMHTMIRINEYFIISFQFVCCLTSIHYGVVAVVVGIGDGDGFCLLSLSFFVTKRPDIVINNLCYNVNLINGVLSYSGNGATFCCCRCFQWQFFLQT